MGFVATRFLRQRKRGDKVGMFLSGAKRRTQVGSKEKERRYGQVKNKGGGTV